jgi:hypothetical protein
MYEQWITNLLIGLWVMLLLGVVFLKVHSMDKMFKEIEVAKIDLGKLLEELDKEQG